MTADSERAFAQTLADYADQCARQAAAPEARDRAALPDPGPLRHAAATHLGASRSLAELTAAYGEAMEGRENHSPEQAAAAQALADELAPVRAATRVAAGHLPRTEG